MIQTIIEQDLLKEEDRCQVGNLAIAIHDELVKKFPGEQINVIVCLSGATKPDINSTNEVMQLVSKVINRRKWIDGLTL